MLLQDCEGTQRLELPVSRTTLKVWGGEPMVISEKSVPFKLVKRCTRLLEHCHCALTYIGHS